MNTNINKGLTSKEVLISRKKYGSNKLTIKKKHTLLKLIIESLSDPIIKILLVALAIKIVFLFKNSNIYETLGIALAVFLASFISAISEYGSEKAFERLNQENRVLKVKVLRNSNKEVIGIDDVVVGDIVYLESGDKIPAEGILLSGEIVVDESSLTGESKEKNKNVIDNELYMGSIVIDKTAIMKVTIVGDKTYYGKIASSIQEKTVDSPLKIRLRGLAKTITSFGYIAAIFIFLSFIINSLFISNDMSVQELINAKQLFPLIIHGLTLSVAVIVMAVPEGLPMMITLVLSSNMKRMLKKNVLVRKLVGIETAGSLNILFTDKTGTLTEGKLKVSMLIDTDLNEHYNLNYLNKEMYEIMYQSLIYNNSSFLDNGIAQGGNSTDKAILSFVKDDNKNKYRIVNEIPFNSKNKYSSITTNYDGETTFHKGAYELILNNCKHYINNNNEKKLLIIKEMYLEHLKKYTINGYRVLAISMNKNRTLNNSTLVGFILIKDEIRKEAHRGIKEIQDAGIDVVMVTGDSKETALSVAKSLNIIKEEKDLVLTSEEFNKYNDEEIKTKLPYLKVLCRSLPEDKNRLVKISQELNLITGMTGDGVYDAPALKRADVGFSMGSGTEVAKETSDIVILDNDISSISTAILYGRSIFKSIRKFLIFQLSVNVCAVLLSVIAPFIGIADPITIIQVLWINMIMDTFAALAFAYEPPIKEYMDEKPKNKKEPILNKYMKNQIIFGGIYSFAICIWFLTSDFIRNIYRVGENDIYIYTAFFGLFIFLSIFNLFNTRTHRINIFTNIMENKVFLIIIVLITIIQIVLIYYGGELFRTTNLTLMEFELMLLLSLTIIPFDFIRKYMLKKKGVFRGV